MKLKKSIQKIIKMHHIRHKSFQAYENENL